MRNGNPAFDALQLLDTENYAYNCECSNSSYDENGLYCGLATNSIRIAIPSTIIAELRLLVIFQIQKTCGRETPITVKKPLDVRMFLPILQINVARNRIIASFAISAAESTYRDSATFLHR